MGNNAQIHDVASRWCQSVGVDELNIADRFVLCWGGAGTGKTLLAQALCLASQAVYLDSRSPVTAFEAALNATCIVLDDVHALDAAKAIAAFNAYNQCRTNPLGRWWSTSLVPPSHMTGVLPDLASRMAWGLVLELLPLPDEDGVRVLQAQAARLGFELGADTAQYLLLRLERNMAALAQHLDSLNQYALTLKKPVNKHLVQQWYVTVYLPGLQKTLLEIYGSQTHTGSI